MTLKPLWQRKGWETEICRRIWRSTFKKPLWSTRTNTWNENPSGWKTVPTFWVDLCWAWSIDPYSSRDFLRRFIHAVPINKIFAFGGDTQWPTSAMAYAIQARTEITHALESEIADGYMTEKRAMSIAERIMRGNQFDCFDVSGTRANIRAAA